MKAYTILLTSILLLAACGRSAIPTADVAATATTAPAAMIVARTAPLTATTQITTSGEITTGEITTGAMTTASVPGQTINWLNTAAVEGDYYILGNPAAPVRLTDYSDFL